MIEFPRSDPKKLEKFDPSTKICTMNCGQHILDPRSKAEVKFQCQDCLVVEKEVERMPGKKCGGGRKK